MTLVPAVASWPAYAERRGVSPKNGALSRNTSLIVIVLAHAHRWMRESPEESHGRRLHKLSITGEIGVGVSLEIPRKPCCRKSGNRIGRAEGLILKLVCLNGRNQADFTINPHCL